MLGPPPGVHGFAQGAIVPLCTGPQLAACAITGGAILLGIGLKITIDKVLIDRQIMEARKKDADDQPGEPAEPFVEDFPTFESAVGEVEDDSIAGVEVIPAENAGAIAQGFTEKWIGTDKNGNRVSAFKNPTTGRFSGGGPSSGTP